MLNSTKMKVSEIGTEMSLIFKMLYNIQSEPSMTSWELYTYTFIVLGGAVYRL